MSLLNFVANQDMYWVDNKQHHTPHIHARYSGEEGIFDIESGDLIGGTLPSHCEMRLK